MPSDLIRDRAGGSAPFVKPFLDALDRMQEREVLRPEQLTARARGLLDERLGTSSEDVEAAFAHGGTGLQADHSHYFAGFALLKSLPFGTAVAVRRREGDASRLVFVGGGPTWTFDAGAPPQPSQDRPSWVQLGEGLVRRLAPTGEQVDVAVVCTVTASCAEAYLAALGVAAARALQALFALPESSRGLLRLVQETVVAATDAPFSVAYLIAADAGRPDVYTLVDTFTFEQMVLAAPSSDQLGWGLVDVGEGLLRDASFYRTRAGQADEILHALQQRAFPAMASLRDLEHRDLERALDALPRRLRPYLRHLVTENRRVQKLVAAVRRGDWQMFGALLLMSHASRRSDWDSTNARVDFVVEQVEQMTLEGMYGAGLSGRGGCVLVLGQPFTVPRALDRIAGSFEAQFGARPDTMLL